MAEEVVIKGLAPEQVVIAKEVAIRSSQRMSDWIDGAAYTTDEKRVASYLAEVIGIGGGIDPIGFLIASHAELARQIRELRHA